MLIRRAGTLAAAFCAALAGPAWGFNQPPANLSVTTFMDGGAPPGLYYLNYSIFTDGRRAVDKEGNVIPGGAQVNAFAQLHQLYYVTGYKLFGAKFALDLLVPLVAVTAKGSLGAFPVTANNAGVGDILAGFALQWDEGRLFDRPLLRRFESDVSMPTGKYDKSFAANPGNRLWTVDSYYSFVWFFAEKWETSLRLWYAYHTENPDTRVRPGQRAHVNYAVSRQVLAKLRLGAAGYALRQLTDDKIAGVRQPDSRERVVALGPGLVYQGGGLTAMLSHPMEFWGQNRFIGSRTTLQLIHRF